MNKTVNDIKGSISGFRNFMASISPSKSEDRNKYFNNPKVIYDELSMLFIFIIWLCVGITAYFGVDFHMSIFKGENSNASIYVTGLSIAFLLVGELIKVYIGTRFVMMFLNGELLEGIEKIGLWILLLILLIFTYMWSFDISSLAYGSNQSAKGRITAIKEKQGGKGVKDNYQDRLTAIDSDIKKWQKQTWQGKLTPKAEKGIKAAQEERKQVNRLIEKEMDVNIQNDSTVLGLQLAEIAKNEKRIGDYGGKSEILLIFSIICLCLCRKSIDNDRLKNQSRNNVEDTEGVSIEPETKINSFPIQSKGIGFGQNNPSQNIQARTPIGFKIGDSIAQKTEVEKKTLIEPIDKKKLYEDIINGYNVMIELSEPEKAAKYEKIIDGYKILIELL